MKSKNPEIQETEQTEGPTAKLGAKPKVPLRPKPPRPRPPKAAVDRDDDEDEEEPGPSAGETVADKYRLDKMLARGGMGSVWKGWDKALDRSVAIKFMGSKIASSKSLRTRFDREAKAAAKLNTPYVVQIYEHGVHGKLPYMVLELLEGEDLHDRINRVGRLSPLDVATILTETARGLRRAHGKGIVHRDLKPRNIFLASDDDEERVKILDFGIAKNIHGEEDGDTTKTGQILGSPNYMSPEQARGHREVDHRSDLWALAVILWKCLTGHTLFSGKTSGDVIVKICTDPIPKFSEAAPGLPTAFDEFFAKALARDPDERYQSATELAEAYGAVLRASADPNLVAAAPPSGERLSSEWTPVSDITPSDSGKSYPSLASGMIEQPGLTPPPIADPGESPSAAGITAPSGTPAPPSSQASLATPAAVTVDGDLPARKGKTLWAVGAVAVLGVAVLIGGVVLAGGDDDDSAEAGAVETLPDDGDGVTTSTTDEAIESASTSSADALPSGEPSADGDPPPSAEPDTSPAPVAKPAPPPRPLPRPRPRPTGTKKPKGRFGY